MPHHDPKTVKVDYDALLIVRAAARMATVRSETARQELERALAATDPDRCAAIEEACQEAHECRDNLRYLHVAGRTSEGEMMDEHQWRCERCGERFAEADMGMVN